MSSRFFCPCPMSAGEVLALPADVAHHALRVLRLRPGEAVRLFNGGDEEYVGELLAGEQVRIDAALSPAREAPLSLTLAQALAVGDKMDWVVQKAVELGAVAVQPLEAERCVLRLAGDRAAKRVAHWQQVSVSASEQCGRTRLCEVLPLRRLADWLAQPFAGERWILDPEQGEALSALTRPEVPVAFMVGPEGGWSEGELAAARAAGCRAVRMGPRVLRTETAGLAALAAMMALWGDY